MKVCIAGGGKVGMYLAQSLLAHRHKVTIIEPQEMLCRSLADSLDIPVICGDAISFDTMRTADVASCDAFVAVTGADENNLVACRPKSDAEQVVILVLASHGLLDTLPTAEQREKTAAFVRQFRADVSGTMQKIDADGKLEPDRVDAILNAWKAYAGGNDHVVQ